MIRNGRKTEFCQSQILVISLGVFESHLIQIFSRKEKENHFHQLYQIGLLVLRTAILI